MASKTSGRGLQGFFTRALPTLVQIGAIAAIGAGSTGCGALSALMNPKAGWALSEPAPMSVVVRRAEVANATAKQVERLFGKTGVNDTSTWIPKTALKTADAQSLLDDVASDDTYSAAGKAAKLRVVPAEAWVATFSQICSDETKYPNLFAATNPELAKAYDDIAAQEKEVAKLKSELAEEDKALDAKDITPDAKTEHQKKKDEIDANITKLEDAYKPKVAAFLTQLKDDASKADDSTKKRISVALVNLRRAVGDAKTDNSVALIRYPLAMPSMTDDIQRTAKRVLADVIEEKTGKRPDMTSLKPEVTLDGLTPKLTLNGLSPSDIGGMNPGDVIEETTVRLTSYVAHVATLVAFAAETQDQLSLEADILDAWIDGFKLDPSKVDGAGDDLADLKVETGAAKSGKTASNDKNANAKHTAGGLRTSSCKLTDAAPVAQVDAPDTSKDSKVADKSKGSKAKTASTNKATTTTATTSAPSSSATKTASATPTNNAKTAQASASTSGSASGSSAGSGGPLVSSPTTKPADLKCDVVVTNAQGSTCL